MSSVDVVIPCYNYARFLPRCVHSVLAQRGVDLRVLVIDDCSTDDTPEIAQALSRRDPRVEVRRHATNRGHIATYNEGLLEWARADYSLLISADDLLAPGALARAAWVMDRHPEVGMTYGMCFVISAEEDAVVPPPVESNQYQLIDSFAFMRQVFLVTNIVPTPTAVVRTKRQQELGGYRPHLPHSGDMEMWLRFAGAGPIGVVRATQAYYRRHAASMSARYYSQAVSDRRERVDAYREAVAIWGARFPQLHQLLEAAQRRFAVDGAWLAGLALERGDTESMRQCMEFALETWPPIRRTQAWARLQAKRLVGPRLIAAARGLLRAASRSGAEGPQAPGPVQLSWWPDSQPLVGDWRSAGAPAAG